MLYIFQRDVQFFTEIYSIFQENNIPLFSRFSQLCKSSICGERGCPWWRRMSRACRRQELQWGSLHRWPNNFHVCFHVCSTLWVGDWIILQIPSPKFWLCLHNFVCVSLCPPVTFFSPIDFTPAPSPARPSTSQYRPILSQFHQVPTGTALYWPRTTKYQPVTPHADQVPTSTSQYRFSFCDSYDESRTVYLVQYFPKIFQNS